MGYLIGFVIVLIVLFIVFYGIRMIRIDPRDIKRKIDLNKRKKTHQKRKGPFYENFISDADFYNLAISAVDSRRGFRKRVDSIWTDEYTVYGNIISQSELTKWSFKIDFDDEGHLTGKYTIRQDAKNSIIPEEIAEEISDKLNGYYKAMVEKSGPSYLRDVGDCDWYCDYCHVYMNVQPGFSVERGKWVCENCGFVNDVTQDNINNYVRIISAKRLGENYYDYYAFSIDKYPTRRSAFKDFRLIETRENGTKVYELDGKKYTKLVYSGISKGKDNKEGKR